MKRLIGFTGTRNGLTAAQQITLGNVILQKAPDQIEAHWGMAVGADLSYVRLVEELYQPVDRYIVGHPPIDKKHYAHNICDEIWPAKEFLVRDEEIVKQVEMLIACPNGFKEILRSGTWATIRYANKMRKPVTIIWPDGSVNEINGNPDMREAEMTESQKNTYVSKISKLLSNGVTEVYMREVMNAIKEEPKEYDLRLSDSWFEANGFAVEIRTEINRHPDYEIDRTIVRKAKP